MIVPPSILSTLLADDNVHQGGPRLFYSSFESGFDLFRLLHALAEDAEAIGQAGKIEIGPDQCLAFQELVQCAHKPRRMDRRLIPAVAYSLLQFGLGRCFGFLETFNPLRASAAVETV